MFRCLTFLIIALLAPAAMADDLQPVTSPVTVFAAGGGLCAGDLICTAKRGVSILAKRRSLTAIGVSGSPAGGQFSAAVAPVGTYQPRISFAPGSGPTSNPAQFRLSSAGDSGSPIAGGLATITLRYQKAGSSARKRFSAATFGTSCYSTNAEEDWGEAPDNCGRVRINGITYEGPVSDPYGLSGTYCSAFIAMTRLQGSSSLRDGRLIQYISPNLVEVDAINGADGTAVVAGRTLARDRSIIPRGGVTVSLAGIGTGLLANDTGGAILGYRLDLYRGAGKAACQDFSNRVVIGACKPGNLACPGMLP